MPIGKWLIMKGYDKSRERPPPDPNAPPKQPPPLPKEVRQDWLSDHQQ